MNEKIRKLLRESRLDVYGLATDYTKWDNAVDRFVTLIVLKCAEIADTAEPFLASDLIKEHFGVKE
jgi:hypothetical protein